MKKSTARDLDDLSIILEELVLKLKSLSEADQVDVAARLKPIAKNCEAIDDFVKDKIKTKLRHKEGNVMGTAFKAVLKLVPVERLNQKLFKETDPETFEKFVRENTDERVTFELR